VVETEHILSIVVRLALNAKQLERIDLVAILGAVFADVTGSDGLRDLPAAGRSQQNAADLVWIALFGVRLYGVKRLCRDPHRR